MCLCQNILKPVQSSVMLLTKIKKENVKTTFVFVDKEIEKYRCTRSLKQNGSAVFREPADTPSANICRPVRACVYCQSSSYILYLCDNERKVHEALWERIIAVGLLTANANTHARRLAACVKDVDRSSYIYPCHHRGIQRERPWERTYTRLPEQETECV